MTKRQRERLKEAGRKIWEGSHRNMPLFHEGVGDLASLIDREWPEKGLGEVFGLGLDGPKRLKKKIATIRKARKARSDEAEAGSSERL